MKIRLNEYNVTSPKLNEEKRIVNISDTHSDVTALAEVLKAVYEINPDFVTMPGDIFDSIDDKRNLKMLAQLLELCQKKDVYISLGNHDSVTFGKVDGKRAEIPTENYSLFEVLSNNGCNVLAGDSYEIKHDDDITLYGINPKTTWYQNGANKEVFVQNLNKMKFRDDTFNLLLSHTAGPFFEGNDLECNTNVDLILAGHFHGAITPQFIQNHSKKHIGLVGPYAKFGVQNAYGHYNNGDTSLIISNGVTKMANSNEYNGPADIVKTVINSGFMPDIDVIDLIPGEEQKAELTRKRVIK